MRGWLISLVVIAACAVGVAFIWKDAIFYIIVVSVLVIIMFQITWPSGGGSSVGGIVGTVWLLQRIKSLRRRRGNRRLPPGIPPPPPSP